MYRPPDPETFNKVVWAIVREIPAGRVSTYGQIASMIPPPEGVEPPEYDGVKARWVGAAMRDSPEGLPWQRVINSQGKISLPKGSAGADKQRALLEMEGVAFDARGRVDFDAVGWRGPDPDWLAEHDLLPPIPLGSGGDAQLSLF
jgi:methylated-DNA-protein-cysteine methyltransferase-like protein